MKIVCLILSIIAMCTTSCATPSGLVKTNMNKWEKKEFKSIALRVEIPTQPLGIKGAYHIKERATAKVQKALGFKDINLRMHPVWKGSYALEPFYLIMVNIIRIDEENYRKYNLGEHRLRSYDEFYENYNTFFSEIGEFKREVHGFEGRKKDHLLILRKDYRGSNGDYVLCGAWLYAGSEQYVHPSDEDIIAVKRILNSIEFIE